MATSEGATGAARTKRKFNEEKWRQILDAAAETFAAKGYEATSIRDVADAVGMLGGSLYYYIKTKEDLLYALIDDFHQVGMEEVARAEVEAAAAGHAGDPLAMLRAVCVRHAEVNVRSRTLSTVFYNDFRHLGAERKQHIVDSRRTHQHRIEELIVQAQAAGEVPPDLDARLTALAMLSMLNATNTWYQADKDTSGRPIGEVLASLLIDGLASRPAVVAPSKPKAAPGATKKAAPRSAARRQGGQVVPIKGASRRKER
ncbi:TetR/AcrR family transcriptional regulator [Acidiferrimicrobium sp. IK]|uniref:TetR/AcrR family transcriptional regulator n=1 Tax=Acidiferrimicrobium sp. IK TaxID=2871700 RepID=UPI0021CB71F8|nr:TetR/AcrR family transcriptional regulator [Acidiferrimicrobium sp. IK]MCU4183271.1 TetR/AcrR family transcriptional regulator [Acidiferrimicrobium sp. IK]